MKIFAIGDLHLSENPAVEKPMDIFGEAWEGHAQKLNKAWSESVDDTDVVIIAGDLSWGLTLDEAIPDLKFVYDLPGTKLIFKGNHDLWWQSITKNNAVFKDKDGNLDKTMNFIQNHAYVVGDVAICGTRGWICPGDREFTQHDQKIYDREVLRLRMSLDDAVEQGAKEIIAVLHYPPTNDKQQESEFTKVLSEYKVKTCVYGHLHGRDNFKRGLSGIFNGVEYKLCSLDYIDCKPILVKEI